MDSAMMRPKRVIGRVVGTSVVEHSRFDFTGKWLHEAGFGEPQDWIALYEIMVREKRPLFDRSEIPFEDEVRPPQPYESSLSLLPSRPLPRTQPPRPGRASFGGT